MYNLISHYSFLAYFASAITIVPFFIATIKRHNLNKEQRLLWILVACSLITEIISTLLVFIIKINNITLFNIYVILETVLISFFYYLFLLNKIQKLFIAFSGMFFLIYSVTQLLSYPAKTLNNVVLTTESLMVITFSVLAFHNILKYPKYNNLLSAPIFWINSAFLLFFSGNLFLHLFSQFLQEYAQKAFYELWGFHSVFNIIFYTLISIGFWKTKISQALNS